MVESSVESLSEVVVDEAEGALMRVLLVDDKVGFLKATIQILEMQGAFEDETAIGLVEISSANPFTESDLQRLKTISDQLTIAINRKKSDKELKRTHDKLKILNERLRQRR